MGLLSCSIDISLFMKRVSVLRGFGFLESRGFFGGRIYYMVWLSNFFFYGKYRG